MFKMVFQAIILTVVSIGFILKGSDSLRDAARTGDVTKLTQLQITSDGGTGLGALELPEMTPSGAPWYTRLDPRKLWQGRDRPARLNTKTIRVQERVAGHENNLAAQLAAQGLSSDVVSVVKLD